MMIDTKFMHSLTTQLIPINQVSGKLTKAQKQNLGVFITQLGHIRFISEQQFFNQRE